ncbi:ATP-dependent DNA helicase DinG [Amphibacillus marinus]|uniref:3'-5' exonuclease DinG n=1 Tax=Amphibacillus marinus TaxID=872970 RepID=A0A1H8GIC8_9BACI|nr:ATP-dependent DNA helicase DinG [Amphibacillus marinus]SEN43921.1 ATP-dependent DNA helicase DinG [Amphibacillus marinus]
MNKFVIVDLETTGNSPHKGDRIIEIGIVVLQNGKIIEQFAQLINPEQHISRFISHLTGITNEMVMDQPSFSEIASQLMAYFTDAYFVAHNVPFDLGFINAELKNAGYTPINQPIIDTVELSRILLSTAPSFKLSYLSEWLALKHDDPHRALSDAYVTAELLKYLLSKLATLPLNTIKRLLQLAPFLKSSLFQLLSEQKELARKQIEINDRYDYEFGLAIKREKEIMTTDQSAEISIGEWLDRFLSEVRANHDDHRNYEFRPGQKEMASYIYHAFQSNQHAIIEAGTGTGKTLAYLVASLFYAVEHKEQVIVSTFLTQLQLQLINQEIPRLAKILPFTINATLLKGKQHYISLPLFSQSLFDQEMTNYDQILTKAILVVWLTETETGDIDEIQLPSSGYRFFNQISVSRELQQENHAQNETISFYNRAISKAEHANLIVVNHALLAKNLAEKTTLFNHINKFIIDEAHHFPRVVGQHYGLQLDYLSSLKKIEDFEKCLTKLNADHQPTIKRLLSMLKEEHDDFNRFIYHYVSRNGKNQAAASDIGRTQYIIGNKDQSDWQVVLEMASRLQFILHDVCHAFDLKSVPEANKHQLQSVVEDLLELKDKLKQFFNAEQSKTVSWIEIDKYGAKNAVYFYQEHLHAEKLIQELLLKKKGTFVFTSASLSITEQFDYFKQQLGFSNETIFERRIPSPYPFQNQVKLCVPNDFPIAKYGAMDPFIEAACEAIFSLAEVTKGRMLILFNGYEMLKKAYRLLKELLDDDFMVIAQGISSGSHERLKKNFQNFDRALLLGTHAFWEGLDIPGDNLSCVVIVRLPFEAPQHPIVNAKINDLKRQEKNPFTSMSLPNAVIRFKQGFGRLIRSYEDRGIVFVCDDRIVTEQYGQVFLNSIPQVQLFHRRTNELIETVQEWL